MEQASERERLFDGLLERSLPEPRAPVKGSFARTGILPSQALKSLIAGGEIRAAPEITADQIQPASLDLRLGKVAYRIRASFLPGPNATSSASSNATRSISPMARCSKPAASISCR